MVSRERILEAAARVYAKHGFKGATTRLIAIEAGVNEVTLFRTFGSKSALLHAVLIQHVGEQAAPALPAEPANPPDELREFVEANLRKVGDMRPLLIHTMGETEERPEAHEFACRGRHQVHDTITTYLRRLRDKGWTAPDCDVDGAAVMMTGTIISDVMGRPIVGDVYPPRDEVAARYCALFLRAIGYPGARAEPGAVPDRSTDETPRGRPTVGTRSRSGSPHPAHDTHS